MNKIIHTIKYGFAILFIILFVIVFSPFIFFGWLVDRHSRKDKCSKCGGEMEYNSYDRLECIICGNYN